jgi:hypothetical protein
VEDFDENENKMFSWNFAQIRIDAVLGEIQFILVLTTPFGKFVAAWFHSDFHTLEIVGDSREDTKPSSDTY